MTDLALQIAGSKLAISIVLGGAVWLAARGDRRPRLCHALCLALLSAVLVPPLISIPLLPPAFPAAMSADPILAEPTSPVEAVAPPVVAGNDGAGLWFVRIARAGFVPLWILGITAILGWTAVRARFFRRFLQGASREAPPAVQREAREIARILGLAAVPAVHTTDALISPMVCWSGGAVRVYIPSALLKRMEPARSRWILAHELAHVRRRDHLVRWLEWLACTVFWWNPVAWWARRRLRAAGELCCDAIVLRAFNCDPRTYARTLMRAIELVRTRPEPRLAPFASAAGSGHRRRVLERRFRMIMASQPATTRPPGLLLAMRGGLVALLALGLVYCGEQRSPTALQAAGAAPPPAEVRRQVHQMTEYMTSLLRSSPGDAGPAARVPTHPDEVWIEAQDLRSTADGEYTVPALGLLVVDYDQRIPIQENETLWTAIAQLPATDRDAGFLVARQVGSGGWIFPDEVPESSSSTLHLIGRAN